MAELSEQTQAIIDRMKAEGDLVRNSGTNSIRQVNVKLDKFQGLFETISSNMIEQTSILSRSASLQAEQIEAANTREQFEEIEPPSRDAPTDNSDELEQKRKTNETIEKIGDSIGSALSLKNIALAGAGAFVGYNILKGFIDERTGGGFTEFENNFGKFASSLGEVDINQTMNDLKDSVDELKSSVNDFRTRVDEIVDALGDPLKWAAALASTISAGLVIRSLSKTYRTYMERQIKRLELEEAKARGGGRGSVVEEPGERARSRSGSGRGSVVEEPGERARAARTPSGSGRGSVVEEPGARAAAQPRPVTGSGRGSVVEAPGERSNFQTRSTRPAVDGRRENGQFASKAEIEQAFKDQRMLKIFKNLVRGLGIIGIALEVWQLAMLYNILNAPSDPSDPNYVSDEDKIRALGDTIGGFIGAVGGLTAGASVGSFFGPWGALILGAIGAGLGAWAGSYIGELIAKWAFDESVSSSDRARNAELINSTNATDYGYESMSQQDYVNAYGVGGTAYGVNNTPDYMRYLDPNYNAQGTPTPATPLRYGGRGSMVEQPGERAAYARQQQMQMLDAVLRVQQEQNNSMADLMNYLGIEPSANGVRSAQLQVASEAGAGGTPIVINNTPVLAPQTINQSNGGSSVKVTNASFGGGMGSGANPYNLPSGIN